MTEFERPAVAIDGQTRQGLAIVADVLLPGTTLLPSMRSIEAHVDCLDRVLAADPRLVEPVRLVGERAAASDSCTLADIVEWAGGQVDTVVFAMTSAYYIAPEVLRALGYPGQERRPVSEATPEETYTDELLDPVRERGAIYVPTPS